MRKPIIRAALQAIAEAKRRETEPVGRVNIVRSIGMPDGSRISVVRKDVMDHALGRGSAREG